jgi:hypothetical protein
MTTTFELTILDDNEADLLLSLLQKFRSVKIGKVQKKVSAGGEDVLDLEKFDTETQRRVLDTIERYKKGDTSHLIQVDNLQSFFHAI